MQHCILPRGTSQVGAMFEATVLNFIIFSGLEEGSEPQPRWHKPGHFGAEGELWPIWLRTLLGEAPGWVYEGSWLVHWRRGSWRYDTVAIKSSEWVQSLWNWTVQVQTQILPFTSFWLWTGYQIFLCLNLLFYKMIIKIELSQSCNEE